MSALDAYRALALDRALSAPRCMRAVVSDERDRGRWLNVPRFPLPLRVTRIGTGRNVCIRCTDLAAGHLFAKALMLSLLTQDNAARERFFGASVPRDARDAVLYLAADLDADALAGTKGPGRVPQSPLLHWAVLSLDVLGEDGQPGASDKARTASTALGGASTASPPGNAHAKRALQIVLDRTDLWSQNAQSRQHGSAQTFRTIMRQSASSVRSCDRMRFIAIESAFDPDPPAETTVLQLDTPRTRTELEIYLAAWRSWFPGSRVHRLDPKAWAREVDAALTRCGYQLESSAAGPLPRLFVIDAVAALIADGERCHDAQDVYCGMAERATQAQRLAALRLTESMLLGQLVSLPGRAPDGRRTRGVPPESVAASLAGMPRTGIGDYAVFNDAFGTISLHELLERNSGDRMSAARDFLARAFARNPLSAALAAPVQAASDPSCLDEVNDLLAAMDVAPADMPLMRAATDHIAEFLQELKTLLEFDPAFFPLALAQRVAQTVLEAPSDREDPLFVAALLLPPEQVRPLIGETIRLLAESGNTGRARLLIESFYANVVPGGLEGVPDDLDDDDWRLGTDLAISAIEASLGMHLDTRGRPLDAWLHFARTNPAGAAETQRVLAEAEKSGGLAASSVRLIRARLEHEKSGKASGPQAIGPQAPSPSPTGLYRARRISYMPRSALPFTVNDDRSHPPTRNEDDAAFASRDRNDAASRASHRSGPEASNTSQPLPGRTRASSCSSSSHVETA